MLAIGETVMAIGKRRSGGSFLPALKYDARVGTLYVQDRVYENGRWESEQRDVTKTFRAAFDMENLQTGWIKFPKGAAPELRLVQIGKDYGEPPDDDFKEGLRVLVKMDESLGGDVRELMSTAVGYGTPLMRYTTPSWQIQPSITALCQSLISITRSKRKQRTGHLSRRFLRSSVGYHGRLICRLSRSKR
jgi:hypothetical protein